MTPAPAEIYLRKHSKELHALCKRVEKFSSFKAGLNAPTKRSAHQKFAFKSREDELNTHITKFFTAVFKDAPEHWKAQNTRVFSQNSVLRSHTPGQKSLRISSLNPMSVVGYFAVLTGAFILPHDEIPDAILQTLDPDSVKKFIFYTSLSAKDKTYELSGKNPTDALAKMSALSHKDTSAFFAPDSHNDTVEQFFYRTAHRTKRHIEHPAIWTLAPHLVDLVEEHLQDHAPKPKTKLLPTLLLQNVHLEQGKRVFAQMDHHLLNLLESVKNLPQKQLTPYMAQSPEGQLVLRASCKTAAYARAVLVNLHKHKTNVLSDTITINGHRIQNTELCE
jgi:hypothetical protein